MPRIRTIKPSFFRSEDVSVLPLRARLTWIGLWTYCDDQGRTKDNARLIKGDIWPLDDVSLRDIEDDLETLAVNGRIIRYEIDGKRYLEITNWRDHQAIQKPTPSKYPPPPQVIHTTSGRTPVAVPEPDSTDIAGKGREGKGKEGDARDSHSRNSPDPPPDPQAPSPKCEEHKNLRNPPKCGLCADARRDFEDWSAARRSRIDAAARCTEHPTELAANCRSCASERLAGERTNGRHALNEPTQLLRAVPVGRTA